MALTEKYAAQIEKTFTKYPDKRSAVMPMLHLAQEEYGWVSPEGIQEVAEICDMGHGCSHPSIVGSEIKRISTTASGNCFAGETA